MTGNQTLIARAVISIAAGAAGIILVANRRLRALPTATFDRLLTYVFAATRLGLFVTLFLILRIEPRGDVPSFYFVDALSVTHGLLPYRDFQSAYAPLHSYLDAAVLYLWRSPLSIMLLAILAEIAMVPLWLSLGRRFVADSELRTAALLYLTSAVSLQFVAIDGQDNVIIALLLALALLLLSRNRAIASGLSFAVGIVAIKFLPLIYAPVYFFASRRRWLIALGAAILILPIYTAFALHHAPILSPLTNEGGLKSPGDLPFILESVTGHALPSALTDGFLLLVFIAIFAIIARKARAAAAAATADSTRLRLITFGMAAITLAFIVFVKKSWPPYLLLALFPICLVLAAGADHSERRRTLFTTLYAAFGVIAVVEHSWWATILSQLTAPELHQGLALGLWKHLVFLALEILLVAGYLWLLAESLRALLTPPDETPAAPLRISH